jgi:hypothetical protein
MGWDFRVDMAMGNLGGQKGRKEFFLKDKQLSGGVGYILYRLQGLQARMRVPSLRSMSARGDLASVLIDTIAPELLLFDICSLFLNIAPILRNQMHPLNYTNN